MSIRKIMEMRERENNRIRIKQPPLKPGKPLKRTLSLRAVVETPVAIFSFIEHIGKGFYGASKADRDIAQRMLLEQWTQAADGGLIDLELDVFETLIPLTPLIALIVSGLDIMSTKADAKIKERIDDLARRLNHLISLTLK